MVVNAGNTTAILFYSEYKVTLYFLPKETLHISVVIQYQLPAVIWALPVPQCNQRRHKKLPCVTAREHTSLIHHLFFLAMLHSEHSIQEFNEQPIDAAGGSANRI